MTAALFRRLCSVPTESGAYRLPARHQSWWRDRDVPPFHAPPKTPVTMIVTGSEGGPEARVPSCRFDERSPDMALNQVMKATTSKLSRLARAPDNQRARTGVRLCGQWRGIARRLSRRGHDRACQRCASPGQRAIGGPGRGSSVGGGRAAHRPPLEDRPGSEGTVLYVGPPCAASWREAAGVHDGPLFRRIRRGDKVQDTAITDRAARAIIRRRAAEAGIEGRISGHSLRVGAAQSLAAAGAGLVEMQTAGRWQSPAMPARYARGQFAARGAVARLRHGA